MAAKLLLADDSVTIQRVIELTFADENVQVLAVGDGKEAIERVQAERPDIVLADIGMPERDGYEVAAYIKNSPELAHIPVLLLTGAFEPIDEARARSVGCEGVLVKPFEPQMVIARVRELLSKSGAPGTPTPPADAQHPVPPVAEAPSAAPRNTDSLEDYFDRLDAALSTLNTAPPPLEPAPAVRQAKSEAMPPRPPAEPPPAPAPRTPTVASPPAHPEISTLPLHEAFAALLSAETGQPLHPTGPTREAITEEVIQEVVRRVLGKMESDAMRRAVLDAAERLVRQEIDRLKNPVG